MKTTGVSQASMKKPDTSRAFWKMSLLLLLLLPLSLMATEAGAAKISFEPNELTATVAPGEVVTVPVTVSLTGTTAPSSYAIVNISSVEGETLESEWINNQFDLYLDSTDNTTQVAFQVKVPAVAKVGNYKSMCRAVVRMTNEIDVPPADLVINIEVSEPFACNQAPEFKDISSAEETINVRNNKEVAIGLSGTVSSPAGCDISEAWYQLTDEYGELDQEKVDLGINHNGTFSVAIPMVASRKGGDEDGRLYTVKFFAKNEAGIGESLETTIVVLHDDYKKMEHDSKRERHDSKKESHESKKRDS